MDRKKIPLLKDREAAVLKTVIHSYIQEGKPVGSRFLTNKYHFNLSSATVRNVMSDLEEMGFIKQPHSSAGRIPTDLGYRYYFNEIMRLYDSQGEDILNLGDKFSKDENQDVNAILRHSTHILAGMSNMTSLMLGPLASHLIIRQIELIPVGGGEVLALFITRSKMVINRRIFLHENISLEEIKVISRFLNDNVVGYGLHEVKDRIESRIKELHDSLGDLKNKTLLFAEATSPKKSGDFIEDSIVIDGVENLCFREQSFSPDNLRNILRIIDEKDQLKSILAQNLDQDGVNALIGTESNCEEIAGCSIVTSTYKIGNKNVGLLGIIGPTRMKYEQTILLVDNVSKMVTSLLDEMSQ